MQQIEERLTRGCQEISEWMKSNKLKTNPDKTHVLLMGIHRRLSATNRPLKVQINGEVLCGSESKSQNLLGCVISVDLK